MTIKPNDVERIRQIIASPIDDFVELARIAGLSFESDFRYANLSGVDFGTADTTGWDLTGSNLSDADLSRTCGTPPMITGAKVAGTKFRKFAIQEPARQPEWYVSYAWGDNTQEGKEREKIVDDLCEAAKAKGHTILRDKNVLGVGDSISAFMRKIGTGDRVFVILSEKYLQSSFCMFELSEIWRTSRLEGEAFLKRVRVFALPETKIWNAMDWTDWAIYWKKEHDALESRAREHGIVILGELGHRRLTQMACFYSQVTDILGTLTDIVQPRTFEELERYGFDNPPV